MATILPAVKGQQNYITYYQSSVSFAEIAHLVKLPEEILGDELLDNEMTMQRKLNKSRVKSDLVPYLDKDSSFFSAVTLYMVPHDFTALEEGEGFYFRPIEDEEDIGNLKIDTSLLQLFTADGQHRIAAIKEKLKEDNSVATRKLPVIIIPFTSRNQVRQLFSDLNLNAKLVSKSTGLSFETRDPVAVLTKNLENRVTLFKGSVNHMSNSLSKTSNHVIAISTLYECNKILLEGFGYKIDELSELDFEKDDFINVCDKVGKVWQIITTKLPGWDDVENMKSKPNDVREAYIHAHGVGWQGVANAVSAIISEKGPSAWEAIFENVVNQIDWNKSNSHWQGISMIGDRMNNTSQFIRATAGYILSKADVVGGAAETYYNDYMTIAKHRNKDVA